MKLAYKKLMALGATWMVLAAAIPVREASAAAYTFTTFDASTQLGGPIGFTTASGINDAGQVVGWFGTGVNGQPTTSDGFILNGGAFTKIDVPNSSVQTTQVSGINNSGQITGTFQSPNTQLYGFVTSNNAYANAGSYTQLDAPNATNLIPNPPGPPVRSVGTTNGFGLNNNGQVIGGTTNGSDQHGFSYSVGGAAFTPIDVPPTMTFGSAATQAQGVNNSGHVAGYFLGADGLTHGFLFKGTDYNIAANYTQLDAPFATVTDINGVHPGTTFANGINNSDKVVGYVVDGVDNTHGFVYDGGAFTEIDVPTAADTFGSTVFGTQVSGIDSAGDLVGTFTDDLGTHGFIATVAEAPEPASFAVFGVGLAGLTGVYRRRVRGLFKAG